MTELETLQARLKELFTTSPKTDAIQEEFDATFARILEIKDEARRAESFEGWKPEDGNAVALPGSSVFTASSRPTYGGSRFYR